MSEESLSSQFSSSSPPSFELK